MEAKELMTKRRIERLASEYEKYELPTTNLNFYKESRIDVFVSHSSVDKDFIKKVLLFF